MIKLEYVEYLIFFSDTDFFDEPPKDLHPGLEWQRIVASSIIKKLETDLSWYLFLMKVIITESRLLDIAKKWLAKSYGNLTMANINYYDSDFFLKDGEIVFSVNVHEDSVVVDFQIRDSLQNIFGLEYGQVRKVVVDWLSEYYDVNPNRVYFGSFEHVELDEIYN